MLVKLWRLIRTMGLRDALGYLRMRAVDWHYERRLGLESSVNHPMSEFGIDDSSCHTYVPTPYDSFAKAMKCIQFGPQDVFLDYGSGKGRVLVLAATYDFAKVVGVEMVPALNEIARRNIASARAKSVLRCPDIEIIQGDAAAVQVPPEVTVIYFYNPFSGAVLEGVLDRIADSLRARPRKISILFGNPLAFEQARAGRTWLQKRHEFISRHLHLRMAVYEASL